MEKRENQNSGIGLGLKVMIVLCMVFTVYNSYLTIESRKDVVAMKATLEEIQTKVEEPVIVTNTKTIIKEEKEPVQKTETKQTPKAESKPVQKTEPKPVQKSVEEAVKRNVATETTVEARQPVSTTTAVPKVAKKVRVTPSAKVRVENRYVSGTTYLPVGKFYEEGTVTVEVVMDWLGSVTSTSIINTTIQNEDILYACRESALKTNFSTNKDDHGKKIKGTITYTFTAQ